MADNTLEHFEVRRHNVACGAAAPFAAMFAGVNRKPPRVVIKAGSMPGTSVVAGLATGWKTRSSVVRVASRFVVAAVAGVTIPGGSGVAADMAACTRHRDVSPS